MTPFDISGLLMDSGATRVFGIKFYDSDFWELLLRLALNYSVAFIIIRLIYKPTRKDSEYVFTYLIFSPLVFFICHLFKSVDLSIGFAFGLFAVFSILRYRTTTIPVKEMTYMFVIIAVAVINALSTKKVSYLELFFTNFIIIAITAILERSWATKGLVAQTLFYENIENIHPSKADVLRQDLSDRLGQEIVRYEIQELDYLRDVAKIVVYTQRQTDEDNE